MNISNIRIGVRLMTGFLLTSFLLAVVVLISTQQLSSVSSEIDASVNQRYAGIEQLHGLRNATQAQAGSPQALAGIDRREAARRGVGERGGGAENMHMAVAGTRRQDQRWSAGL